MTPFLLTQRAGDARGVSFEDWGKHFLTEVQFVKESENWGSLPSVSSLLELTSHIYGVNNADLGRSQHETPVSW